MPGFPDWQDFPVWCGPPLINVLQVFSGAPTVFGPFPVSQWSGFHILASCQTAASGIDYSFAWAPDAAFTQILGTRIYTARVGQVVQVDDYQLGPFVRVTAVATGAGVTGILRLLPTNQVPVPTVATDYGHLVTANSVALAAAANSTLAWNFYRGKAVMSFSTTCTAWTLLVQAMDRTNTLFQEIIRWVTVQNNSVVTLHLPGRPIQSSMTNNGAGAGIYSLAAVAER